MKHNRWGLVGLWMVVIFLFSQQNATTSIDSSNWLSEIIASLIYNVGSDKLIEEWIIMHIREFAHIGLYAVLGATLLYALNDHEYFEQILYTLLIGIGYAIIDEIHQYFVPGRAFELYDILLDTLGVILMILIYTILYNLFKKDDYDETTTH